MRVRTLLLVSATLGLLGPAFAQYKVVGPDGRVTYTDRPPATEGGKVQSLGRQSPGAATSTPGDASLPFELRQVVARYPVVLYTGASCPPCDAARQLLRERGVPYAERQILSDEDSLALHRITGGRTIPSLGVGTQMLRGFNPADWAGYLDVAGYPRESRLPRGWQPPAPAPLVARASAPGTEAAAAAEPARSRPPLPVAPPPAAEASAPSIRF